MMIPFLIIIQNHNHYHNNWPPGSCPAPPQPPLMMIPWYQSSSLHYIKTWFIRLHEVTLKLKEAKKYWSELILKKQSFGGECRGYRGDMDPVSWGILGGHGPRVMGDIGRHGRISIVSGAVCLVSKSWSKPHAHIFLIHCNSLLHFISLKHIFPAYKKKELQRPWL